MAACRGEADPEEDLFIQRDPPSSMPLSYGRGGATVSRGGNMIAVSKAAPCASRGGGPRPSLPSLRPAVLASFVVGVVVSLLALGFALTRALGFASRLTEEGSQDLALALTLLAVTMFALQIRYPIVFVLAFVNYLRERQ